MAVRYNKKSIDKEEHQSVYRLSEPRQRKTIWESWRRWFRLMYLRFITLRGHPEYLARGLAAGVFAGFFPFFGFQTLLGVAIAVILRGHKFLAIAGTWISNPFTYLPLYFFNFQVGRWLLGVEQLSSLGDDLRSLTQFSDILEFGAEFATVLLVGSSVVGLAGAIASYVGGFWVLRHWRQRHLRQSKVKTQKSKVRQFPTQ